MLVMPPFFHGRYYIGTDKNHASIRRESAFLDSRESRYGESKPVLSADSESSQPYCSQESASQRFDLLAVSRSFRKKYLPIRHFRKNSHLRNGNPIQLQQPFSLRYPVIDKNSIQTFQIGKADQFIDIGVIPDVPFFIGIGFPPFLSCHPEHRHIQDIRFVRINNGGFAAVKFRRNQVLLDGIRMNPVIQFGKFSLRAPAKLSLLFSFEPLKFFNDAVCKFYW